MVHEIRLLTHAAHVRQSLLLWRAWNIAQHILVLTGRINLEQLINPLVTFSIGKDAG